MINRMEPPSLALFKPNRVNQNKSSHVNRKEQEDDRDLTSYKASDTVQTKQLKNKMKLVMNKLIASKKQKQLLAKENKTLQEQIIALQTNLRQMVPGFSNTSSSFPIHTELINNIAEFYKQDCLDKFFDLLYPQVNTKGVIYFYSACFKSLHKRIMQYFQPAFNSLQNVGCFNTLEGPIMNVLRKSFQSNYLQITDKILQNQKLQDFVNDIQSNLILRERCKQVNQQIKQFLIKMGQLLTFSVISDPPLQFDIRTMGHKVLFNPLKHEPFDGFIKPKQQCWIVLPQLKKTKDGDTVLKSFVLQTSYVIEN